MKASVTDLFAFFNMKLDILISRYRKLRKTNTWPQLIRKILLKLTKVFFLVHRGVLREWDIVANQRKVVADLPVFAAREEDIDDSYDDLWYTKEQAIELIRRGHLLYIWKEDGKIIFYQWVRLGSVDIPHLGLHGIDVPTSVAYTATAYVPPEYAGRLLLKRAQSVAEMDLRKRGIRYLFSLIEISEVAINRYHERVIKNRKYQEVTYIRVLFLKLYLVVSADGEDRKWFFNTHSFWNEYSPSMREACSR